MKSKISFFNHGLFKSTLRRFWPLWLVHFMGWFLFMPMMTLMNGIGVNKSENYVFGIAQSAVLASPVIAFIMAILTAMAVFSFMYSARSTGLVTSLPVRREAIFGSAWISGVSAVIGSNLLIALLTFLFSLGATESTALALEAVCIWLCVYSMQFLLFFGIASIIAVMTGSIVVLPILYIIFNFLAVGMEAVVRAHFSALIWGMSGYTFDSVLDFLSPLVYMAGEFVLNVNGSTTHAVDSFGSLIRERAYTSVSFGHWLPMIIYCAVGLILSVSALLIFRKRRMEAAGDVIAVRCLRPVFKYGVAICSALCGGLLLYIMLYSLFESRSAAVFIMIPSMIIFAFVGYFGARMLLEKSFHVFRGSWVGFIVVGCLCVIFTLGCDLDVFGIGTYVPKESTINCITVSMAGEIHSQDAIADFRELHEKIVSQKEKYEGISEYGSVTETIMFRYTLKGGRVITRQYTLPADDENLNAYFDLVNSPALLLERFTPRIPVTVENCASAILWTNEGLEAELTPEQAVDFYENALIPDIKAGRKLINDRGSNYLCTVSITLTEPVDTRGADTRGAGGGYYDLTVEVNDSCTECVAWVKANLGLALSELFDKPEG